MKKMTFRILSLILCAVMLCLPAFAAEPDEAAEPVRLGPVQVWGRATRLESGSLLLENSNESDPNHEIIVHLGDAPVVDAVTGLPMDPAEIRDGDTVYAWVGPAMTLSLPPQSSAVVAVANIPADYAVPQYYEIAERKPQAMIAIYPPPALTYVELVTTDGTELKITDQAQLTPYLTRNIVRLEDLCPGSRILVWSSSQGQPERVLVFPYAYRGYLELMGEGWISVNDTLLVQHTREINGMTYLPLRAVAEALGCDVAWDREKGAVVSEDGQALFSVRPDTETAVTADGEQGLMGPCLIADGVTYLSAWDLSMLLELFWTI